MGQGLQPQERLRFEGRDRRAERRAEGGLGPLTLESREVLAHLVQAVALDQVVRQQKAQVVGFHRALALMAQREFTR